MTISIMSACRSHLKLLQRRCNGCLVASVAYVWSRQLSDQLPKLQKPVKIREINYDVYPSLPLRTIDTTSGWMPPADTPPALPFRVNRSAFNNVPVYTDFRNGRTRVLTIIRKVDGDIHALADGVKCLLGNDIQLEVNEVTSQIRIKGKFFIPITKWLMRLGF